MAMQPAAAQHEPLYILTLARRGASLAARRTAAMRCHQLFI